MTNVLIVEDDPMVAALNESFISQFEEMKVIASVKTLAEARSLLAFETVDLILLDVFLPGETGIELLAWLRMQKSNVAVILITADDDVETVKEAIRYGAIDYLIKPFTFDRFKLALEKYLKLSSMTKGNKRMDQSTLDQYLNGTPAVSEEKGYAVNLPKGLSKLTLGKVYQGMQNLDATFSTKELAEEIDLSRISTKKYLQFLVDQQVLTESIAYLDIGRPLTKYALVPNHQKLIQKYLRTMEN